MRSLFLTTLFSATVLTLSAQISPNYLINRKPIFQEEYQIRHDMNGVRINMYFNDDSIRNPHVVKRLGGTTIYMVDLVYTDYRNELTFDQPELNLRRLQQLKKVLPEAFSNSAIIWNFVAQTGCKNPKLCSDYFHGFVVYYRAAPTKESIALELKKTECGIIKTTYWDTIKKYRVVKKYQYLPHSKKKAALGVRYERSGLFFRDEEVISDTILLKRPRMRKRVVSSYTGECTLDTLKKLRIVPAYFVWGYDTVVQAVLNRNKNWEKMVIAVDVTGSMSPYSNQVYSWIALQSNLQRVRMFTFFNDGDFKPDNLKKTGQTGGIYDCTKISFDNIMKSCQDAMSKGGGGDAPENDVEAILHIQKEFSNVTEIILIADNFANMRDYSLLEKVKVPVHVILCGASMGANVEYLQLARATGGSIHTIEQDLYNLAKLMEGETITISKQKYVIRGGKFELTY